MKIELVPFPLRLTVRLVERLPDGYGGLTIQEGSNITVKLQRDCWNSFVEHECQHVLQMIEKTVETRLDDETSAYYIQYLANRIRGHYEKKRNS